MAIHHPFFCRKFISIIFLKQSGQEQKKKKKKKKDDDEEYEKKKQKWNQISLSPGIVSLTRSLFWLA